LDKAGYTYCAIASLAFLDRLPKSETLLNGNVSLETSERKTGLINLSGTIRWLSSRQVAYYDRDGEEEHQGSGSKHENPYIASDERHADAELPSVVNGALDEPLFVGFNGRANKVVDTCYCFWVSASLEVFENTIIWNLSGNNS
jgi:geranylgeranyl transferase type-1 subunit beta